MDHVAGAAQAPVAKQALEVCRGRGLFAVGDAEQPGQRRRVPEGEGGDLGIFGLFKFEQRIGFVTRRDLFDCIRHGGLFLTETVDYNPPDKSWGK